MTELGAWQNFYVVVGSSAGALIGLQFVVLSLIANRPGLRVDSAAGGTFTTPTIVHFSAVLTLAAVLCAPWRAGDAPAFAYGAVGLAGLVYTSFTIRGIRRQTVYRPEWEDWIFHAVLPLAAYATLTVAAVGARSYAREALWAVGATALSLLLVGIHNAWDTVTYHVFARSSGDGNRDAQ
jgi:hypothetical protein